jgi:ribonuclease BN (tRNA processing enzyme)
VSLSVTVLGCSGTYAGPGEACSGYLVRSAGANVVVDLGPGTLATLQEHTDVAALDALVLSHEHPDHWLELPTLRNAMRYVLGLDGLTVYATAGTWALARAIVGDPAPPFRPVTVAAGATAVVGDQHLAFDRTDHPVETLAVRIDAGGRSLLYTADTGPAWDAAPLAGVDLLLAEATLIPEEEGRVQHLTGRQAGALARAAGAGRLVVTHVAPGVDREAQRAAAGAVFRGPVEVARPHVTFDA